MPESVTDRCTKSHEHIFLLSKKRTYFYDADAIKEPTIRTGAVETVGGKKYSGIYQNVGKSENVYTDNGARNKRDVWKITTKPYAEAHFATFPPELPELCIKAGTSPGDKVLDPFAGAGTTGLVADRLGRDAVLIELNPEYADIIKNRIYSDAPMFVQFEGEL